MSKRVDATITCPGCGRQYPVKLYRTIWGEYEENRNLVMNDQINVLECPHCGFSFKAPFAFMYVDIKANFAVWWEPQHDPSVDTDTQVCPNVWCRQFLCYRAKSTRLGRVQTYN